MANYQQLQNDVMAWLNRRDVAPLIPSWVTMTETDIAELLRARCMIVRGSQQLDGPQITLPGDFVAMESIRDALTGKMLDLHDSFTGPNENPTGPAQPGAGVATAYRLVGDCVEFLPHPQVPVPLPPNWTWQIVNMVWYAKPQPLQVVSDSNTVLNAHYQVYLFGCCRYGAKYELDDDRAQQMDGEFATAVAAANAWKVAADYSGAPLRAVVRGF
jgi:hypothetical protein